MCQINDKKIIKKHVFNASVDLIWKKWTTHEGLLTFFGSDNKIQLKSGGPFEIYFLMENEYGLRGSETCKVLSYLPKKMFSFSWNAPPEIPEVRNHEHKAWVVLNFKALSDKQTELTLHHLGFLDGEAWNKTYVYFDKAWDMVFGFLEKAIKS
jgi:uncharacterized protein YndB with AHSA1/START domain